MALPRVPRAAAGWRGSALGFVLGSALTLLATQPWPAGRRAGPRAAALAEPTELPPGPYQAACGNCTTDGHTLSCDCAGQFTALSLLSCAAPLNISARGGFLQCAWRDVPPPQSVWSV